MLDFLMNNREYELQSDNQLASILVQFDSDYAMNVIEDTLTQMFNRFDTLPKPNIVKAFKQTFQLLTHMTKSKSLLKRKKCIEM